MSLAPRLDILEATAAGNKQNLLINGAFDLWQRNFTSVAGINQYGADRWRSNSASASQTRVTSGTSAGLPATSLYGNQYTSIGGGGNIAQRIEAANVRPYVGQFLTLQFRAGLVSGTPNFSVVVRKPTATDDWTGSTVVYNSGNLGVPSAHTGSYSTFYYTFLVDADMGAKGISVELGNDATVWSAVFAEAMLTPGINPIVPFSRAGRNFQEELAMAQRYYEKSYDMEVTPGTSSNATAVRTNLSNFSSSSFFGSVYYKTQKRTTASLVAYDGITANRVLTFSSGAATTQRQPNVETNSTQQFALNAAGSDVYALYHWTAAAEL